MKRFFAVFLALTIMFSAIAVLPIKVYAAEVPFEKSKTATAIDDNGRFKVKTQVSGVEKEKKHDEVIVMVDGSYSTDDDWITIRNAILKIGKKVLGEKGSNTLFTVMTFGMGDNVVLKHVENFEELDKSLTKQAGKLLYGRSFTNCEAGFTGISEYIKKHDNTLNKAYVVYMTDGDANTDETKHVFDNWTQNAWLKKDALTLAKWSVQEELTKYEAGETKLSHAYKNIFDNNSEEMTYDEKVMAWADEVWEEVYAYSDMELGTEYTISDTERAFVKFDKENETHVREIFYYTTWGRDYPDGANRAYNAGIELANNKKLTHLYLVDINSASSWMSDIATSSKVSFLEAGNISNLPNVLDGIFSDSTCVSYSKAIVTEYISKWVNLDMTTIKVVNNNTGKSIWTYTDGWEISQNRPTSYVEPVVVEMVPTSAYEEGGPNVVGNENDIIYKLTWYVKDGALRQYDYSLVYEVEVDVYEKGFKYNTKYPSSGYTTIEYIREGMDEFTSVTKEITAPEVIINKSEPETKPETVPDTDPTYTKVETVEIKGKVTWKDDNNKYEKRPQTVVINLMADGDKVASKKVRAKLNSSYSFSEVPKFNEEGNKIVYTVTQNKVANYKTEIDGYNIVNTYEKYNLSWCNSDVESPRTGDYIMIAVCVAIVSGVLLFILFTKKKNK